MAKMFIPAGYEDEFSDEFSDDYDDYPNDSANYKLYQAPSTNASKEATPQSWTFNSGAADSSEGNAGTFPLTSKINESVQLPIDDLRVAVINGDLDIVRLYLDKGVDVDVVLKAGWTPLMYAAYAGKADIVLFLLENGADSKHQKDMYYPLMATCCSDADEEEILKCVTHLLENGAEVNCKDRYHISPLMYAAKQGKARVTKKLIDCGADVNKRDSQLWTALFWAASRGHKKAVNVLKSAKADCALRDNQSDSAADVAFTQGHEEIAAVLDDIYKAEGGTSVLPSTNQIMNNNSAASETPVFVKYGELELFLHGLGLGNFIPTFHQQKVEFPTFLQLTDKDLEKMGIFQIGVRKKILDGIQAVHKKEWQTTSLATLQYDKVITSADAAAMVANISKHALYIGSTIGFIRDQIKQHPEVVEDTKDTKLLKQLLQHSSDAEKNVEALHVKLKEICTEVRLMLQMRNLEPVDAIETTAPLVLSSVSPSRKRWKWAKIILSSVFLCVGIWKKDVLLSKIVVLSSR